MGKKKSKVGIAKESESNLVQRILEGIVSKKEMPEIYELVGDKIK